MSLSFGELNAFEADVKKLADDDLSGVLKTYDKMQLELETIIEFSPSDFVRRAVERRTLAGNYQPSVGDENVLYLSDVLDWIADIIHLPEGSAVYRIGPPAWRYAPLVIYDSGGSELVLCRLCRPKDAAATGASLASTYGKP